MDGFILLCVIATTMFAIGLAPYRFWIGRKTVATVTPNIYDGPYRTAAVVPPEPKPKPIKPKREFKMPPLSIGKHPKTFGYIFLVCACIVGMGVASDSHFLGEGLKNASMVALGVMGLFLLVMGFHNATDGFKGM